MIYNFDKKDILILDECDSTNSYMKRLFLKNEDIPFCILAKSQSSGRGRTGKKFFCARDKGIYISFFAPISDDDNFLLITPMTASAVCRALSSAVKIECGIKWVNDIFIGNKKLGGILCERIENNGKKGIIIGIGINVLYDVSDFPEDISDIATSLKIETGRKFDMEIIISSLFDEIKRMLSAYPDPAGYYDEYIKRSIVLGKKVRFGEEGSRIGEVIDILPDFSLLISENGDRINLTSSRIFLI